MPIAPSSAISNRQPNVAEPLPLPLSGPDQRAGRLAAACVALGAFILLNFAPYIFNDGDTGWHLATGRLILDHLAVPKTDPFSFTATGTAWVAHEWLAEVIMATALQIGGWPLLSMLAGATLAALLLIIGNELARWIAPPKIIIALSLIIIMLLPSTLARPHLFAWPLLAFWTVIMLRAREADKPPPLTAALLMLLWANLHASFIFGLFIAGMFGLEALVASPDRRATLIGWSRFGMLVLVACLLTPHGLEGLLYPLMVSNMAALKTISEWQPTNFSRDLTFSLPFLLSLFILLYNGVRVPPIRLTIICVMIYMALIHVRHQQMLPIVGSLILAAPLGLAFGRRRAAPPAQGFAVVLGAAFFITIGLRLVLPAPRPDAENHPGTAIAHIPDTLRSQHVLNEYGFGGSLIYAGISPFIDGRADMYGDKFTLTFDRIRNGDMAAFKVAVDRWQIGWTIFAPTSRIVARLDADPQWKRLYADRWAVIHVRQDAENPLAPI